MNKKFEIYFDDLTKRAKIELMSFYEIESEEELNFDVFPIFTLEVEEDESA